MAIEEMTTQCIMGASSNRIWDRANSPYTHTNVFSMGASSNTICEDDMDVVLFVCFVCLFVCLAFCLEATLDNHVCAH